MNIDDELRRLFDDERLDLAIRPGAEQRIVAGARRIRRRRFAAVTAAAVVAVVAVGSGIALAATSGQESLPPAISSTDPAPTTSSAPPSTTAPTSTTRPPTGPAGKVEDRKVSGSAERLSTSSTPKSYDLSVIGPNAFGPLTLGMSEEDALATGLVGAVETKDRSVCTRYTGTFGGSVLFSASYGLVRVSVTRPVASPDGIRFGSTVADVRAAYPDARDYNMGLKAGNFSFYIGGTSTPGDPWPETSKVVRIDIDVNHDCVSAI
jgi:hypothetical protein